MATVCGSKCDKCVRYQKECQGCENGLGPKFWLSTLGESVCPIIKCAQSIKKVSLCCECPDYPCETYMTIKSMPEVHR